MVGRFGRSMLANQKMNKSGNSEIWRVRHPMAALGNGAVQRAASWAFRISDVVSTSDVVRRTWAKRRLVDGRKVWSGSYHHARRVLASMADPVGRQRGRGRAWLWRPKPESKLSN